MTVFNCNVCCSSFYVSGHKTLDDDDDDDADDDDDDDPFSHQGAQPTCTH